MDGAEGGCLLPGGGAAAMGASGSHKDPSASTALTFTVGLFPHCERDLCHFQLFLMNPDRWRAALELQPSLTSALFVL